MDAVAERQEVAPKQAKRCSDFDWECAHVMCHANCHRGGIYATASGQEFEIEPADGYCPYLTKDTP